MNHDKWSCWQFIPIAIYDSFKFHLYWLQNKFGIILVFQCKLLENWMSEFINLFEFKSLEPISGSILKCRICLWTESMYTCVEFEWKLSNGIKWVLRFRNKLEKTLSSEVSLVLNIHSFIHTLHLSSVLYFQVYNVSNLCLVHVYSFCIIWCAFYFILIVGYWS